jgi:uncharacterized protein YbbC (DUF1343 family)
MTKVIFQSLFALFFLQSFHGQPLLLGASPVRFTIKQPHEIQTGADQVEQWVALLKGKKVGLIANQTSLVKGQHLADLMLEKGIQLKRVFGPEHGFRGQAGAGERISDTQDEKTGLPIVSLYGKQKKPSQEHLKDLDILVFDIQDVGARFYTYISTMALVMEACAEAGIPFMVLDRPNPNGHFVDGPVLQPAFSSFVGMHAVPVVHGMTVGEYAKMVNGEGWLPNGLKVELSVLTCKGYTHNDLYQLPVPPSPNLPNMASVYLYPSLCFFEGTPVSVGRGTDKPFQVVGFPGLDAPYTFTPRSIPHAAPNPPHKDKVCKGYDLSDFADNYVRESAKLYLLWIMDLYQRYPSKDSFFTSFFNKLAGNQWLAEAIRSGKSEDQIRAMWRKEVDVFMKIRSKYLLYPDFTRL